MLDTLSPDMPETIRYLSSRNQVHSDPVAGPERTAPPSRRRRQSRQMRERRTAWIMMGFGLVLGALELFIVLSYL
jgi:hypothetical protein